MEQKADEGTFEAIFVAKEAEFLAAMNDLMQQVTGNPLLEGKVLQLSTAYDGLKAVLLAVIQEKGNVVTKVTKVAKEAKIEASMFSLITQRYFETTATKQESDDNDDR